MKKIRVLVADDEKIVRDKLVEIISTQSGIELVGEAENGIQATKKASESEPDVMLLDLVMPKQDGLTTISKINELAPEIRILVLTKFAESDFVFEAIKAGAIGYILKDAGQEQIFQAIQDAVEGRATISPSIATRLIQELSNSSKGINPSSPLTPRELEILRLIAQGLTSQEIAKKLSAKEEIVNKCINSILDKANIVEQTHAALYAVRTGIASPRLSGDATTNAPPPKIK